jgi:NTP pyrophosphatase (non-canonical NTP hydrolase)
MLAMLLQQHRQFMDILGIKLNEWFFPEVLIQDSEFLAAAIGLIAESTEVLNELNTETRPWKGKLDGDEIRKKLVEEVIDVLFYLLEVMNMLQMSEDEVKLQYTRKLIINLVRVRGKTADVELKNRLFDILHEVVYKAETDGNGYTVGVYSDANEMRKVLDGCSNLCELCQLPLL